MVTAASERVERPWASGSPVLMGIVNVTPDSFSDGGLFLGAEAAAEQALGLAGQGAGIVDIGGESTRPGFTPVSAEQECARVLPVLEALAGRLTVPVSIDTTKAAVARRALAHGATIVNDIWGLQGEAGMADAVAEGGASVVMMHNRHAVDESIDIVDDLRRFFDVSVMRAEKAGVPVSHMVLDPGVGFGKTPAQQIQAIHAVPLLRRTYGLPVLVGLSRKSVLRSLTGSSLAKRLPDTLAANLAALALGATIFRVHDVADHAAAFTVFRAFASAGPRDASL